MEEQRDNYRAKANPQSIVENAKRTGVGIARIHDQEWIDNSINEYLQWADDVQKKIDEHMHIEWPYELTQVR